MFYLLGLNFKIFLYFLKAFLSFAFVIFLKNVFPEYGILVWLFKISIVLLLMRRWYKKIKNQNKLKYFEPSFVCMGMYGILIIGMIWEKGELGGGFAIFILMAFFAGAIIAFKVLNDSYEVIKRYDPQLKINIEVRSPDDYFENFSRAEDFEMKLSELKKEAPPAVVKAIIQREAGKLIPFFHMEMIFLSILVLEGTPWLK